MNPRENKPSKMADKMHSKKEKFRGFPEFFRCFKHTAKEMTMYNDKNNSGGVFSSYSTGLTAEYPSTNLHKNSVYCILTRSSENAAKFKQ